MLLLGLISILQIIFLPGLIALIIFKIKTDTPIQKWLYIFSFSLFFNYCLVTTFTLLSIYSIFTMSGVLIFELIILIIYCRNEFLSLFPKSNFREAYTKFCTSTTIADKIIILFSALIVLFYLSVLLANIGTIFYFVDTVNNYEWNRWAIDFANNILPKYSSHFPQLLPANWSICYVMIGKTDVDFFPKAIMPLFFISNLLIFIDLAHYKKNQIFLMGLIIYGLFAPIIYSLIYIVDGNADLPVSFFVFLTFYSFIKEGVFLKLKPVSKRLTLKGYRIIFLFASMAAATKLAGFYNFSITLIILLILIFFNKKYFSSVYILKIIIVSILICLVSLFWYFRAPDIMYSGLNQPQYLAAKNYLRIFINALNLMYYNLGLPVFIFFTITIVASLLNKKFWFITLVMVIIPTILWIFKYSSDFRNLSFVIPFICLSSAFGLYKIIGYEGQWKLQFHNKVLKRKIREKCYLTKKERLILISIAVISAIMFFIFISNKFYVILLGIYEFINKYYFLSHRIVYFIEFGLLLHVDFYQRVLIILTIILFIASVFIITKIRIKAVIISIILAVIFLNFTFFNEKAILKYQVESFNKVDARNYYEWIKMVVNKNELHTEVYTNFKEILHDKIPREINFEYIENVTKTSLKRIDRKKSYLFLKYNLLTSITKEYIKSNINTNVYKILLDDKDFVLLMLNSS